MRDITTPTPADLKKEQAEAHEDWLRDEIQTEKEALDKAEIPLEDFIEGLSYWLDASDMPDAGADGMEARFKWLATALHQVHKGRANPFFYQSAPLRDVVNDIADTWNLKKAGEAVQERMDMEEQK